MAVQSWVMWSCAALFYAYQYILRVLPSVLKADLSVSFNLDAPEFGHFAGIYYLGYTLAHIPIGVALDRYGPKHVLPVCVMLCLAGLLPLLYIDDFSYSIIGRCVVGIGSSGAVLGMFKIIRMAFDEEKFTRMLSLAATIGLCGAIFGGSPIQYMLGFTAWQTVVWVLIILGVALIGFMYASLPALTDKETGSPIDSIKMILKNKWVWIVSLASGFLVGPLEGYADAWLTQSLTDIYGLSTLVASNGTSLVFLSLAIGYLAINWVVDRLGTDQAVALSGVMMLLAFVAIMSGGIPLWAIPIALFVLGFFSAYQVPAIYRVIKFIPPEATSLVSAIANMIIMVFGSYFHSIIGK
ncbi:MAG: MFS transporter, partial [Alphaproteobacteria bacterium]|nr:MFS transporter [Alphaproteobacteria bacterium]